MGCAPSHDEGAKAVYSLDNQGSKLGFARAYIHQASQWAGGATLGCVK